MTTLSGFAHHPAPLSAPTRPAAARGQSPVFGALGDGIVRQVAVWIERARTRAQLRALDDRMLRDIGLSVDSVRGETDKPFWIA
ncbi:DUF1127 domain-containing protein [Roseospira navarrensis]|uniref:DUF1127 domain-containing protein n=1 Tax=Roseospira navarrensis TaxID=140058 RepID=A0A7X2D2U8_9PROT|nr:DUF1127 domain-containing protein [Roseospira navarrensis]MQX36158.1 DUF1127 domain-containing protein [Roseospira navarrensis]